MGRTYDEIAFYNALSTKESAVQAMGDAKLKVICAPRDASPRIARTSAPECR